MKNTFSPFRRFAVATLFVGGLLAARPAEALTIYGLTKLNNIVSFDAASPGIILTSMPITGLVGGQVPVAMDVRPATGQVYILGYNGAVGNLYTVNPVTGVATLVGGAPIPLNLGAPLGSSVAMDFNPTVDRLRVVGANRSNYRLNPIDGTLIATDGVLTYAPTDPNSARTPNVKGIAYDNSYLGAVTTTLYAGDLLPFVLPSNTSTIYLDNINPPAAGTLNTIQAGTQDNVADLDFDIFYNPGTATQIGYASAVYDGGSPVFFGNGLGLINLQTATITTVGPIGGQPTADPVVDIAVALPAQTLWIGTESSAYNDPNNWSPAGVPTGSTNITIQSGTPFSPLVSDAESANNVVVASGATFTVGLSGVFSMNGNLINNGTFQGQADGRVELTGPALQLLNGAAPIEFADLTIGTSNGKLGTSVSVRRVLLLNGNLTTAGNTLTLLSDASGTAMVVNSGGTVNGSTTVQRYIDPTFAPGPGYRHLSAPVATTFADLATPGFTPIVNPAYNSAPNPLTVTPYPNILGFNEARAVSSPTFTKGYFSPAALSSAMVAGRGYSVYMTGGLTPDFVGTLGNGNVTVSNLTKTGNFTGNTQKSGWHLLGNPYPSPIDWDLVTVPAGMSPSISLYRSTGGATGFYVQYVNGVGPANTDWVPSAQAFFARVLSGAPLSFTFTNASRLTSYANPPHYRAAPDARPTAHLTLRRADQPVTAADEAWIYFEDGATAANDLRFDAEKMRAEGEAPSIFTLANGTELAINGLPADQVSAATVALGVVLPKAGTYELSAAGLRNFTGAVTLVDYETGTEYDLTTQPSVRFRTAGCHQEQTMTRFALRFGRGNDAVPTAALSLDVYPNPVSVSTGALRVSLAGVTAATATAELVDVLGRPVVRQALPVDGQEAAGSLDLRRLARGTYTLRVVVPGAPALTRQVVVTE